MSLAQNLSDTGRGVNGSAFLTSGMQSATDPIFIDDRAYVSSMNTVNRGGLVQTRPGYQCLFRLPDGNLQGGTYFRPLNSPAYLVFAVSGIVYASLFPFVTYAPLPGIKFYKSAKQIFWATAFRSATLNTDGTIAIVDTTRCLMMQDGGYSRAAYWDGAVSRHLDPNPNDIINACETPLGGPMACSGGRLWVSYKNQLFSSDIDNPLKFTESQILGVGGTFFMGEEITGLAEIPGLATPQLVVFTEFEAQLFRSGIRDRTLWKSQTSPPFQSPLFPETGCLSHKSIISQYGMLWWMSHTGLINFNAAQQAAVTSALSPQDVEMAVSKGNLSPNLADCDLIGFENYLLASVPSGSRNNRHTWVVDKTVIDNAQQASLPAWNSIWTGTNPVEWMKGPVDGTLRIFHVSRDEDGANRLWEAFTGERSDGGLPITSYLETKTHIDFNPRATGLDLKKFVRAEVTFTEVVGDVSAAIYWAGTRGVYKKLAEFNFIATTGALETGVAVGENDVVRGYRPQTRIVKTPSVNIASLADLPNSICGVESGQLDNVDIGFSLLIVWNGRAAVRSYRIWADPEQEKGEGSVPKPEAVENIVVDELEKAKFAN